MCSFRTPSLQVIIFNMFCPLRKPSISCKKGALVVVQSWNLLRRRAQFTLSGWDYMGYRIFFPCLFLVLITFPVSAETFSDQLQNVIDTHKRIAATRASVDSLKEGALVSKKALWPELSATAFKGHENRNNAEGTANTRLAITEFDFTITHPIDVWYAKGSAVEISQLQIQQGELGLQQTIQSVTLEAITATINLNAAMLIEEYARTSVSNIKEQAKLEDAKVTKGAGLTTDVLQAKIQLAGAEARLTLSAGALAQAVNRYRAVFGYEPPTKENMPSIGLPLSRLPSTKAECVGLALANNFQIKTLRSAEQLARTSIRQTRATQLAPDLNLVVDSKFKDNISGIKGRTNEWIAKLELKYNFNVAGAAFNNINSTEYNLIATSNQLQDATNLIEEQAKNTFEQFEITRQNAAFLENQANISGEFLALAREERRLGTRSLIDVLSGETAEINALSDAEAANSQVAIAAYTLLFIIGELTVEAVEADDTAALSSKRLSKQTETEIESQMKTAEVDTAASASGSISTTQLANAEPASEPVQAAEPNRHSVSGQSELITSDNKSSNLTPLAGQENYQVLESTEPEVQLVLDRMETLHLARQELAALESPGSSAIRENRLPAEESIQNTLSSDGSSQLISAQAPEPARNLPNAAEAPVANTAPVEIALASRTEEAGTLPALETKLNEELAPLPKINLEISREFISENPNFQRLWSY